MKRNRAHCWTASATLFAICTLALILSSCSRPAPKIDPKAYAKEIEQYRAQRVTDLKSETGWLTLIGLFWLKDGENKFGSDLKNEIVLPKAKVKPFTGKLILKDGVVRLEAPLQSGLTAQNQPVTSLNLNSDADGKPTVFNLGSLTFQIIKRGDKFALRVRDKESPDRANFAGIESYPADLKWRIEARFERYDPPKPLAIMNVLNMESDEHSPGAVQFEVAGKTYRLDAVSEPDEPRLFMIFADQTNGRETYGAGRYLYVDPPDSSSRVLIDFNKAYSPPCAFTNFATCPLPPDQNRLPISIQAGEKFRGHAK
jgi:uncharacterized protein (DUF1684 family)